MNIHLSTLAAALVLALPVSAEVPLSAAEFESYTTGKTLYFEADGVSYGIEQYLENRQVRWSFLDGECKDGTWYAQAEYICFEYEDGTGPQCWTFYRSDAGLKARFAGDPPGTELYETRASTEPMQCLGPKVGV